MAAAVLVSAAVLVAAELGHDRTANAQAKIMDVSEASQGVLQLMGFIMDAETGQRGYLLTKNDGYLNPYLIGVSGAKLTLDTLLQRYQKSADTQGIHRLGRIATLAGEKFAELEMTVWRVKRDQMEQAMEIINADIGLNKMTILRKEIIELLDHNEARVNRLRQESIQIIKFSRLSVVIITAINMVLLVIVFRRLSEGWRQKEREAAQLKSQQEWLDTQVRERTAQLEQLSIHLQDVLEAEKIRLARELHDELGSILTAAKMDVTWVRGKLGKSPHAMDEKLERTLKNIDQGILVKRRLIEDLRPSTLSSFGLIVAARELAEDCAARNEWNLAFDVPDAEPDIGPDTATALYRVLQETLNNASKYAQAKHVSIKLACSERELILEVVDDGVGFRLRDIRPKALGIVGMRQRVQARGGSFEISSNPEQGCRTRAIIPLKKNEACVASAKIDASSPVVCTT